MSLHTIPIEELRAACKQKLETLELWLRKLIHEKLTTIYGDQYLLTGKKQDGSHLFNAPMRNHVQGRLDSDPGRFAKPIDSLLVDHLISILCRDDLWNAHFRPALTTAYPGGHEEARRFMDRLVPARNKLMHANPINTLEAERVLCYSDDIFDSLKQYYISIGMNQEYNAPIFVRFSDNQGHNEIIGTSQADFTFPGDLRPGDGLRCEVEVDASFQPEEYDVTWTIANIGAHPGESGTGTHFDINLTNRHVGESLAFVFTVTSKKDWHRHGLSDATVVVRYRVLPPIN